MDWVTTTTLLNELRDFRNEAAWNRFVQRFRSPVVGFARGMGVSSDDAEDVAQETMATFAKAYREGRYDRGRGRLRAWLFGIAYRKVLKQRSRAARSEMPVDDIELLVAAAAIDDPTATEIWNREWDRTLLDQCLKCAQAECPAENFRAFVLVVLEGRSPTDAALEMGVPVKKVYNGKHRVLTRMRRLRDELEGTDETGELP